VVNITVECIENAGKNTLVSEDKYRIIFENSAVAITVTDEQERIVSWNNFTEVLLGMTKDDLYLKPVETLYPVDEWNKMRSQNIRQKGMQHHFETKMLRKNNEPLEVDVSLSVMKNAEGKIIGSIGVIKDITDQKIIERAFAYEHNRLQTLLNNIPDSIYFKDEMNKFVLVNNAKASHSNMQPEGMFGKTDFDFLPETEARRTFEDDKKIIESGRPIINKMEKLTSRDGSEKWMLVTKIPWIDEGGKIIGTMGISRDVTEWKKAEEQLSKEHELLQTLMIHIPDSIYFKDEQNRFVLVNKAKASHWNVTADDMIGKTDFDFLPPDEAQKAYDDDTSIIKTGQPIIDKIEKITGSEGLERWVSVTKLPRFNKENMIIGTMGISRDITKRIKEKKETEKYKKVAIGQNLRMIELRDKVKEIIHDIEKGK
jgi:two-component system sensor histidine kinase/response regulator